MFKALSLSSYPLLRFQLIPKPVFKNY
uniref:Uncharacterized protein n=1 Tax=Nelumbo nucifera TaxID=4432 RepID=A0A822YYS0_NELNU|nr:TPA_asm: hypothetical protein HUJ06_006516 [Nelumbo nucifera]